MASITGGSMAEVLVGTAFDDTIRGGAGNDTLLGLAGDDWLSGGAGADTFDVGSILLAGSSDTIADFDAAAGDVLLIDGDALADLDYEVSIEDADADGDMDAVISLEGNAEWSVVLTDVGAFDEDDDDDDVPPPPPVNQTLTGTAAADTLTGGAGNDTITGLDGNDLLDGGAGNDSIAGGAGDDVLLGGAGNDRLDGGDGNDTMTGGDGADTFVFTFGEREVEGGTSSYSEWRAEHGLAPLADGVTTQGDFASSYTQWLESLVEEFALGFDQDLDGDVEVSVDINQNDPDGTPIIEGMTQAQLDALFTDRQDLVVKTGNTTHVRYFSDDFASEDRVIFSGEGQDVITDFDPTEGDRLEVAGIDGDEGMNFMMRVADVNGDGTLDTEFELTTDGTWTVQLLGYAAFNVGTDVVVT